MRATDDCPCGTGDSYGSCCLPLHAGEREADTAEQLMRSRYSAFAARESDYLWRTWHPRTRPEVIPPSSGVTWVGLEVIDVRDDEVEFRAFYREGQRSGTLHERSRFAVRARRWFYLDGEQFS